MAMTTDSKGSAGAASQGGGASQEAASEAAAAGGARQGAEPSSESTPPGTVAVAPTKPTDVTVRTRRGKRAALVLAPAGLLPLSAPIAFGLATLSGILYWAAFPGVDLWPLTFVAWIPLILAMHRQTAVRAMWLGCVAGLAMNFCGHFWLVQMLRTFSGFSTALCVLFTLIVCAFQGGRSGFMGWLYGRATARGWNAPVIFAAAFVASELAFPVLFVWYYAATVHQVPALMQSADTGGPILVGLSLVAANLAFAELALAWAERRRGSPRVVAIASAVPILSALYGAARVAQVDAASAAAPSANVGVVQANMGLLEKREMFEEGMKRHLDLSHEAMRQHADFLLWSETSAMRPVRDESYRAELSGLARRIGLPTIFGSVIVKIVPDEREYVFYNSAVVADASGAVSGRYDKEFLLAFGEYLPFGEDFPILYKWSPNSGHFAPGTSLDPLMVDVHGQKHAVTPLICYEDIVPRFTNAAVRHADPELLVNLTNDAWFGDTAEPWEHLALSQFRAVEHHRYFVRGTNSGVSAVIDPVGRVVKHGDEFKEQEFVSTIHWLRARTAYELFGDWPWVVVTLGALVAAFRKRSETVARESGGTA